MTVSKELTRLEHSALRMTITIGKDVVASEYDDVLREYAKTIQIKGFRKGKVPRPILERKLGESLKGEVVNHLIEKGVASIFDDPSFPLEDRPLSYSSPMVEEVPVLNLDSDLVFSVVYDIMPSVQVDTWTGFEIAMPDVEITEDDVNRELEGIRERNAIVIDREEGAPAANGDVVTIDYCLLDNSGAVDPLSQREGFTYILGSGKNRLRFDEDLIGMTPGETRDLVKTYPADLPDPGLAGQTLRIRVKLTAVKERQLPALDDEFAQDVSDQLKTLDDLKHLIRARLVGDLENRIRTRTLNSIIERIMARTSIDLPESMIRMQTESQWRATLRNMGLSGEALSHAVEEPLSPAMLENWRPDAVKTLHSRFVLEAIIKALGITASEEELLHKIEELAQETGEDPETLKAQYTQEPTREYLEGEVKNDKVLALLLKENTVVSSGPMSYLEFLQYKSSDDPTTSDDPTPSDAPYNSLNG